LDKLADKSSYIFISTCTFDFPDREIINLSK
jgi:hypothetical protein